MAPTNLNLINIHKINYYTSKLNLARVLEPHLPSATTNLRKVRCCLQREEKG